MAFILTILTLWHSRSVYAVDLRVPISVIPCNHALSAVAPQSTTQTFELVPDHEIRERLGHSSGFIVAWTRGSTGRQKPLFSSTPEFKSKRELPGGFFFGTGWNPDRRAEIVPLEVISKGIRHEELVTNRYFQFLPRELREIFAAGKILQTVGPGKSPETKWSLLMMIAPDTDRDEIAGRTGILLKDGIPIILKETQSGKEFLVELKGAGSYTGGFIRHNSYSAMGGKEYTVLGGAVARAVEREHNSIEKYLTSLGSDTILSAGYVTFETDICRQGILIRLTPGTLRATFSNNLAFQLDQRNVERLTMGYGKIVGLFMGQGAIPLSHPENMISDASWTMFYPTDLGDLIPVERFPIKWAHRDVSLEDALGRSLASYLDLQKNRSTANFTAFKNGFIDGLRSSGFPMALAEPELRKAADLDNLSDTVFKKVIYHIRAINLHGSGFRSSNWTYIKDTYSKFLGSYMSPIELIGKFRQESIAKLEELKAEISRFEGYLRQPNKSLESQGYWRSEIQDLTMRAAVIEGLRSSSDENLLQAMANYKDNGRISADSFQDSVLKEMVGFPLIGLKYAIEQGLEELVLMLASLTQSNDEIKASVQLAQTRLLQIKRMSLMEFNDIYQPGGSNPITLLDIPYFEKTATSLNTGG